MDFLKVAVIVIFVILTMVTIKIRPEMHQPLMLEDADFKLTRISDTITAENIPTTNTVQQDVKVIEVQPQEVQQTINKIVEEQQPKIKYIQSEDKRIQPTNKTVQVTENKNVKTDNNVSTMSDAELLYRVLQNVDKQISQTKPEVVETKQTPQEKKTVEVTEQKTPTTTKPVQTTNPKNPYMTEQEEIIAWNKWRSNIQNQIMRDSNIDFAPLGTIFNFTFMVDKFGNVSNIKVECSNPNFMGVARNNVKPAISNLQRKPILNFPRGTQRTTTVVTGLFMIGTQERYSSPSDFSDFERVTH